METVPEINIPFEELKSLVVNSIKVHGTSFEFKNLCNTIGSKAVNQGIVKSPFPENHHSFNFPLQKKDENRVREIIWNLIIERVLTIGDFYNDSWPNLSLTEYGEKVLTSNNPVPNDPSGYLNRIKNEIPELDNVIEIYLSESIRTYNINQLLSATITLGCASEKALLLLIETYRDTFKDNSQQEKFIRKTEGKFIKTQFGEFSKDISGVIGLLPNDLKDNYNIILAGIFEMIRRNRNSAGHPTGEIIDKDTLFAYLQVFIPYCRYIYDLRKYFADNKH
jgi:hypothetical protein